MYKDKFEMILQKDEEIKWSGNVNIAAGVIKSLFSALLVIGTLILFSFIPVGFLSGDTKGVYDFSALISKAGIYYVFILSIVLIPTFIVSILGSANTFLCITNKRIIKRHGAFNNKFIHYSLKNVGTINVTGELFDSRGAMASANLSVTIKDFASNENSSAILNVISLRGAYDAYKLLSGLVEGNNEALRIKEEK